MGVDGQHHTPATLPPGKIQYPLYRRLGGPVWMGAKGNSWTFRFMKKLFSLPELVRRM